MASRSSSTPASRSTRSRTRKVAGVKASLTRKARALGRTVSGALDEAKKVVTGTARKAVRAATPKRGTGAKSRTRATASGKTGRKQGLATRAKKSLSQRARKVTGSSRSTKK